MRILFAIIVCCCAGCASYRTPGGPIVLQEIDAADSAGPAASQPAPHFPANLVVVRVQAPAYTSWSAQSHGNGRYSVVTAQELLTETQLRELTKWPSVDGVATLSRALLPDTLDALDDLRLAAAKMQADILLVYTVSTSFQVQGQAYAPLTEIALGKSPDREAKITSTASAMFTDVRSGYRYGAVEATAESAPPAAAWASGDSVDQKRLEVEQQAFAQMLSSAQQTWADIAARYR